jgi:ubiquinone/menaquinone biosynthesis C-methylase UbiE
MTHLKNLQMNWDQLGREDPFWAILSDFEKRGNKWDIDEFFLTGEFEIQSLIHEIETRSIPIARKKALDFGCGAGRLTRALSNYFDEVLGLDIAPSMVRLAEELNRNNAKCKFLVNEHPDLKIIPDSTIDLIYSSITLQHIPPEITNFYIREFLRVLKPEGLAVFQLPGGNDWSMRGLIFRIFSNSLLNPIRRWKYQCPAVIELYSIPLKQIKKLVESEQGELLDVKEDQSTGRGWISYQYWIVPKRGGGA